MHRYLLRFLSLLCVLSTLLPRNGHALVVVQPIGSLLSSSSSHDISDDVAALANLRYDEWIGETFPDTSRHGFQRATAELYEERALQGAIVFLAKQPSSPDPQSPTVVVGAAELSPIELRGAYTFAGSTTTKDRIQTDCLYVTDVVTAKRYRRQGVAQALMEAAEEHARSKVDCSQLLLHVQASNTGALQFYRKLGYRPVSKMKGLNVQTLAENAGTAGQLLLRKTLKASPRRSRAGRGFGTTTTTTTTS